MNLLSFCNVFITWWQNLYFFFCTKKCQNQFFYVYNNVIDRAYFLWKKCQRCSIEEFYKKKFFLLGRSYKKIELIWIYFNLYRSNPKESKCIRNYSKTLCRRHQTFMMFNQNTKDFGCRNQRSPQCGTLPITSV